MNKPTQPTGNDLGSLADDARALMAATAEVSGEKIGNARKRLAAALESAKEIAGRVRDKTSKARKLSMKPCMNVLIKPLASPSVPVQSSAISSPAGAPAIAPDPEIGHRQVYRGLQL